MKDVLNEISRLRDERGWSDYQLAIKSDLLQSNISAWYHRNQVPTIATLEKICKALEVPLSLFFAEDEEPMLLTPEQYEIIDLWSALDAEQKTAVMALMERM